MDQSQIDSILEHNNIVDVIGSYFPLKRAGSNYKARCPFHDEKTPSFVVSEKKQIFKCFGCGKSGNVITFVRDYEKISFFEALKKLAHRAGITFKETKVDKKKQTRKDLIYKIYTLTNHHFRENLEKFGKYAKEYLIKRNLSSETIKKFEIGYALDSFAGLKNYLLKNNINEQILMKTGLFGENEKGTYDIFRNRLMFPIHSVNGKIIAFGGRTLAEDQSGGKYINSPTTEIYIKGNELYGLFSTRYEISKKDFALISEGYLDFLRLYEKGFTNSVASLGTSLTDSQINLLSRYTNNFYLLYDGDIAGRKAAIRAASNVLKKGANAKIIELPIDDDPDSFLLKNGNEALENKIKNAKKLPLFIFEDKNLNLDQKTKLNLLFDVLNEMTEEISQELFAKEIAETFKISEHSILSRRRKKYFQKVKKEEKTEISRFQEERDLLKIILNEKSYYKKVAEQLNSDYFLSGIYEKIFEQIAEHIENINQVAGLLDLIEDEITRNTFSELLMEDVPKVDIEEVIKTVKLRKYQDELKKINKKIFEGKNFKELSQKKNKLKKKILGINKKVVRKTLY
ncbi:MAG TPA: DNA primase [Candidatus Cloacimonetes bacterium]|nr:DNA primase [Candidatus Cloacimonadota bacterium]